VRKKYIINKSDARVARYAFLPALHGPLFSVSDRGTGEFAPKVSVKLRNELVDEQEMSNVEVWKHPCVRRFRLVSPSKCRDFAPWLRLPW